MYEGCYVGASNSSSVSLYSRSSGLIFPHDCTRFIAPANFYRLRGGTWILRGLPASMKSPDCLDLPSQQEHCWGFSCIVGANPRLETSEENESECAFYIIEKGRSEDGILRRWEESRVTAHSDSFLGEINEKPHCAYTSARNNHNGDISSRWKVILLQIRLYYSLLFIIMRVSLCLIIHTIFLHFAIVDTFFFFLPYNKATFLNQSLFIFCTSVSMAQGTFCFSFSAGDTDSIWRGKVLRNEGFPRCPVHHRGWSYSHRHYLFIGPSQHT